MTVDIDRLADPAFADPAAADPDELLALDEALRRLEAEDPRRAQVVLLRHFAGRSVEETAEALGTSPATVKRDWQFARAWLLRVMEGS